MSKTECYSPLLQHKSTLLQHQTVLLQHNFQKTIFSFFVQKQSATTEKFLSVCYGIYQKISTWYQSWSRHSVSQKQSLFFTVGAVRSLLSKFFQQRKFLLVFVIQSVSLLYQYRLRWQMLEQV